MPELPEVEFIKRQIAAELKPGDRIVRIETSSFQLRASMDLKYKRAILGETLQTIERRAKYILFHFENYTIISHLGMTGGWSIDRLSLEYNHHDHIRIFFESGLTLTYNDPRRFGFAIIDKKKNLPNNRWLKNLGPEPFDKSLNAHYFKNKARGKKTTIKSFIMDQKNIVGIGNIYASEALFKAGLKPTKKAGAITLDGWERLVESIQSILSQAIAAGGTTLQDYRHVNGQKGDFQNRLAVYDRAGENCRRCHDHDVASTIVHKQIVGRSTYWCPACQK